MMILKQRRSIRIYEICKEDYAYIARISHKSYRSSHHGRLYRRIHRQAIDEDITED
ncbi:MAG: hypothetical protein JRJ79_13900 [Deltaproteobacteria bacterium]|nr:hypothetical protein [Deltaproteobacteria bacterium]